MSRSQKWNSRDGYTRDINKKSREIYRIPNRLWVSRNESFSFGDSNLMTQVDFSMWCCCLASSYVADASIICSLVDNYQYSIIKMKVVALALLASASAFSPQAAPKFG